MEYERYTYRKVCRACQNSFDAWLKDQMFCISCFNYSKQIKAETKATNTYVTTKGKASHEHRRIAEVLLERKLHTDEVIHHLDSNPRNNSLDNLLLMPRSFHSKLHSYLDNVRVIFEKSNNENQGNCWDNLRVPLTTTWLETTCVTVQKLSEIGQSAAEPLKQVTCHEEGSETSAPDT